MSRSQRSDHTRSLPPQSATAATTSSSTSEEDALLEAVMEAFSDAPPTSYEATTRLLSTARLSPSTRWPVLDKFRGMMLSLARSPHTWEVAVRCLHATTQLCARDPFEANWFRALNRFLISNSSTEPTARFYATSALFSRSSFAVVLQWLRRHQFDGTLLQNERAACAVVDTLWRGGVCQWDPNENNNNNNIVPLVTCLYHASAQVGHWRAALDFHSVLQQNHIPAPPLLRLLKADNALELVLWASSRNNSNNNNNNNNSRSSSNSHGLLQLDYNEVSDALHRALIHRPAAWRDVLGTAQQYDASTSDPLGRTVSLVVAAPYLCSKGLWHTAALALQSSILNGTPLPTETISTVCVACFKSGQWLTSLRLLRAFSELALGDTSPKTLTSLLEQCFRLGHWSQGLKLLQHQGPDTTFDDESTELIARLTCSEEPTALAPPSTATGRVNVLKRFSSPAPLSSAWHTAMNAFTLMMLQAERASQATKYSIFLRAWAQQRDVGWSRALSALSWMDEAGMAANAAGYDLLVSMCDDRHWSQAISMYNLMKGRGVAPLYSTMSAILRVACDRKKMGSGTEVVQRDGGAAQK
eukprot:PhM_4_TR1335/c1_g1_i1/m.48678